MRNHPITIGESYTSVSGTRAKQAIEVERSAGISFGLDRLGALRQGMPIQGDAEDLIGWYNSATGDGTSPAAMICC